MKKTDLEMYRKKLLDIKTDILSGMQSLQSMNLGKNSRDFAGDLSIAPKHMADLGTDNYDREFYLNLAEEERERIFMIEKALERMEAGTYGVCEDCHQKISDSRLEAVPYATFCIPCKEKQERDAQPGRR